MKLLVLGKVKIENSDENPERFSDFELLILAYLVEHQNLARSKFTNIFWSHTPKHTNRQRSSSYYLNKLAKKLPKQLKKQKGYITCKLATDADDFAREIDAGNYEKALSFYQGSFLNAIEASRRISLGEEVETWLFEKRANLQTVARETMLTLAEINIRKYNYKVAKKLALQAFNLPNDDLHTPEDYLRIHTILMAAGAVEASFVKTKAIDMYREYDEK